MIINVQSVMTTDRVSSPCLVSTNTYRLIHKPVCKSCLWMFDAQISDASILPYLTVFTQNTQKCLIQHYNNNNETKR